MLFKDLLKAEKKKKNIKQKEIADFLKIHIKSVPRLDRQMEKNTIFKLFVFLRNKDINLNKLLDEYTKK